MWLFWSFNSKYPSHWMGFKHQSQLPLPLLLPGPVSSSGLLKWDRVVRHMCTFAWRSTRASLPMSPHLTCRCSDELYIFVFNTSLFKNVFLNLPPNSRFPSSQSPHPSLRCWIIETDWSSCSQLCVRVKRETEEERERGKEGWWAGSSMFKDGGFVGCQVCWWRFSHPVEANVRTHWCPILERKREVRRSLHREWWREGMWFPDERS